MHLITLAYCSFLVVQVSVSYAQSNLQVLQNEVVWTWTGLHSLVMQEQFTGFTKNENFQVVYMKSHIILLPCQFMLCSSSYHVCEYFPRDDKLRAGDIPCYRDYTREGKRVNTHSLYVNGVKLPRTTSQGEQTWKQPLLVKLNLWSILLGTSIFVLCAVPKPKHI